MLLAKPLLAGLPPSLHRYTPLPLNQLCLPTLHWQSLPMLLSQPLQIINLLLPHRHSDMLWWLSLQGNEQHVILPEWPDEQAQTVSLHLAARTI